MKIDSLVRFPVKGMGPDTLSSAIVEAGGALPFDREFAIAHGATEFDVSSPNYLEKHHFLMLMRNPQLAAVQSKFAATNKIITLSMPDGTEVSGSLENAADRKRLEESLHDFIGHKSRGGPPTLVFAKDHRFFDVPQHYLSLINLASVEALGQSIKTQLDPIRFRANINVSGLDAWQEKRLVGKVFTCGDVCLRVVEPIQRCAATSVNPETAIVDVNVPYALRKHFDTLDMGLYLEVIEGGRLESGAKLTEIQR